MRDYLVRASFHKQILSTAHADQNTFVLDELGLRNGYCRADIAVLNGKMVGYEIKTDKDSLARLKNQMIAYNEVFDNIYIITGQRHLNKILKLIPVWWGVFIIKSSPNEEFTFKKIRNAKRNPNRDCLGIARLLWKDELLEIVRTKLSYTFKGNVTKQDLYDILQREISTHKLSKIVLHYLKSREGWRTGRKELS